ncbi:porin [Escherichia coli]
MVTASRPTVDTDFFGLVDGLNFAVQYQGKR